MEFVHEVPRFFFAIINKNDMKLLLITCLLGIVDAAPADENVVDMYSRLISEYEKTVPSPSPPPPPQPPSYPSPSMPPPFFAAMRDGLARRFSEYDVSQTVQSYIGPYVKNMYADYKSYFATAGGSEKPGKH